MDPKDYQWPHDGPDRVGSIPKWNVYAYFEAQDPRFGKTLVEMLEATKVKDMPRLLSHLRTHFAVEFIIGGGEPTEVVLSIGSLKIALHDVANAPAASPRE